MNILIVHNYYQIPGGEDTVVANEKKLLENNGHKVSLYSRDNSELNKLSFFRKLALPVTTVFNPRTYMDIRDIIWNQNIEIVHVHNTLNLVSPSVYYAALSRDVPVVQTIHNFRMLCPGATFYRDGHICEDCVEKGLRCAVRHKCYRDSRLQTLACVISMKLHRMTGVYRKLNYICLTEFNKEKLLKLRQIEENRVYVKPNFTFDMEEWKPCRKVDRERIGQYVFVGRVEKLKGIDILLRAWKQVEGIYGDGSPGLMICGKGPMEKWCKNYIEENGLKTVEMRGFIPNREIGKILAESRALILPTQLYEGFPMTILEAYGVGTPVICSEIGNAGSIVTEGITGLKFRYDSSEDLANKVRMFENRPFMVDREIGKQYSALENYLQLMEIYQSVADDGHRHKYLGSVHK